MTIRRFVQRNGDGWHDVEPEGYVPGSTTAVTRHTLVGARKEAADELGSTNELRYFSLPPGQVSRLEKHEHEHWVIVGEGVGRAIVGTECREVRTHDVVYVGPMEPHQFVNAGDATFGFFCMVPAERDFPQLLGEDEIATLRASEAGAWIKPEGQPPPRKRERAARRARRISAG